MLRNSAMRVFAMTRHLQIIKPVTLLGNNTRLKKQLSLANLPSDRSKRPKDKRLNFFSVPEATLAYAVTVPGTVDNSSP
jgi:hypothetical protein